MKIISLWQPWASLIIENKKHFETRSWATKYRGPIGIHAAKKPYAQIERLIPENDRREIENALGFNLTDRSEKIPIGVIIGSAILTDCILITEEFSEFVRTMTPAEYAFGDFSAGRYAWSMEKPIKFKEPIPANGRQQLWNFDLEAYLIKNTGDPSYMKINQ